MRITPRNVEIQAIVEVLEGADTFEKAAAAVFKKTAELMAMRDTWAFIPEGLGVVIGPYGSEIEARAAASEAFPEFRIVPLSSPGRYEGNLHGVSWAGYCQNCNHFKELHLMDGTSRGKCSDKKCKCAGFQERK